MQAVHDEADATRLFAKGDIKVKIDPYQYYTVANAEIDFIHVFGHIISGKTTEQKAGLSKKMANRLK